METELKFIVPSSRFDDLAAALRQKDVRQERLQARYFDTADGRLAASRVSLRLRSESGRWVQTVKALTPHHLRRLEHNADRNTSTDGEPLLDIKLHDGTPAGDALRKALPDGSDVQLVERFRTDVDRLTRLESSDGVVVELALDSGKVVAGDRSDVISELELELKSGPVQGLFDLAGRWAVDRGLCFGTVSKAGRGDRLLNEGASAAPVVAAPPAVDRHAGPAPFLAAVLSTCLNQVLGNASELGLGLDEEGHVHQLRVGLRRLRTALREIGDFADGVDPAWEPTFRRVFQALGAHRDVEAVLPKLRAEMSAAGLRYSTPPSASTEAMVMPAEIVRDAEFQRALLGVMALCEAATVPRPPEARARRRLRRKVAKRLDRLHDNLGQDARRFSRLSPDRQHRARKRLKRLRYLAEFAAPLFREKRVRRYLKSWRDAQDALGETNDHWVGLSIMRADPQRSTDRRHAIRWTLGTLDALAKRCERTLRKAVREESFWRE